MTIRNPIPAIRARYREHYSMPNECKRECAARNIRRILYVLPILLAFGVIMTLQTIFGRGFSDARFWIAFWYYGAYIAIGAIPLAALLVMRKKRAPIAAQNAVVYATITAGQLLCIYQKTISSIATEGYLVWTIATIIIIALCNIEPMFFLASMLIQFAAIVIYESANGSTWFLNLGVLVLVTVSLSFTHWHMTIRDYRNVTALRDANDKSEDLLRNIMPQKVIDDLREKGTSDPELFEQVSILFTDLVNFTEISSTLTPEYLIGELSDLFSGFDCIIEKYGCTRIKTIGDAYMAVCGLPDDDPEHAKKIVQAGLDCLGYLEKRNEHSDIKWKMRVGVHSGSVVAGIVGTRKYIYDIFGDSVNIASRMESSSNEMRVNVSEETYNRTKECFAYEPREPQRIKGKGYMNMYFAKCANKAEAIEQVEAAETLDS